MATAGGTVSQVVKAFAIVWESPTGPQISGYCLHPRHVQRENSTFRALTDREALSFENGWFTPTPSQEARILRRSRITYSCYEMMQLWRGGSKYGKPQRIRS